MEDPVYLFDNKVFCIGNERNIDHQSMRAYLKNKWESYHYDFCFVPTLFNNYDFELDIQSSPHHNEMIETDYNLWYSFFSVIKKARILKQTIIVTPINLVPVSVIHRSILDTVKYYTFLDNSNPTTMTFSHGGFIITPAGLELMYKHFKNATIDRPLSKYFSNTFDPFYNITHVDNGQMDVPLHRYVKHVGSSQLVV